MQRHRSERVQRTSTEDFATMFHLFIATVIGTSIEYYDFFIYGTATALVFGQLFFPPGASSVQSLAAASTFALAFFARPLGAVLFGHFGDRVGRKSTLTATLLTMGLSTIAIGVLPGYQRAGMIAPLLLCLVRFGQGLGIGGEWGGAALFATEYAPRHRRVWFGMFPQLGPSIGFLLANGMFFLLFSVLSDAQFHDWGWRVPFIASAVLLLMGLYVRLKLAETPAFVRLSLSGAQRRIPFAELVQRHGRQLIVGALAIVPSYACFSIASVFALDFGVRVSHIPRMRFVELLCIAIFAAAATTILSAALAQRFGSRRILFAGSMLCIVCGLVLAPLLGAGTTARALLFLVIAFGTMGMTFGPMGAVLAGLFPVDVRYTGASAAYHLGGVLGASLTPYAAELLLARGGLPWVGLFVSTAGCIASIAALLTTDASMQDGKWQDTRQPAYSRPKAGSD
ncbi:MFS transporter [Paraburkholderia sp. 2C]